MAKQKCMKLLATILHKNMTHIGRRKGEKNKQKLLVIKLSLKITIYSYGT
jgi:hypothetical protein